MFSFSFFKVTNVFICLQPPLQSLPALFLPPSLQGSLVAFSWRGNPRPSFYSFSLSTALDIIESIFLVIFLADNSGFQILLLQMLIALGFIFSQLPDHLRFHHPKYHLKCAGISQVYPELFINQGAGRNRWLTETG